MMLGAAPFAAATDEMKPGSIGSGDVGLLTSGAA